MSTPPFSRRAFLAAAGVSAAAASSMADVFFAPAAQAAIPGPASYTASWASVDQHPAAPEWFQDAKFGIYYHWGAFSVPAYSNEWYPRRMYISGDSCYTHHNNAFGTPTAWPYHYFIDGARDKAGTFVQFAPKLSSAGGKFDPDAWAQLFLDAGAKFAGPVAEHHDGFSMWNSSVNAYNSSARGPKLDLLALHGNAIRAKGLKFFVAMHHAYNFTGFYDHVAAQSDANLKKLYGQLGSAAENQLWFDKLKEIVDRSQPDIIWQDFNLRVVDEAQRLKFLAYYYNQAVAWGREVVATYKDGFNTKGEVFDFERGGPADIQTPYWLTDDSISSSSWCYTSGIGYYSLNAMLHSLIDRVSKNGNMVLNIAPMADGTIPAAQQTILRGMGDYLRRFGESIYVTRNWTVYGEGPTKMGGGSFTTPRAGTAQDIRFTRNKTSTVLYATILGWPGSSVTIASMTPARVNLGTLVSTQLLGSTAGTYVNLAAPTRSGDSVRVALPSSAPFSAPAYVVKFTFSGPIGGGGSGPVPSAVVSVYPEVGYGGTATGLALGDYTAAQLQSAGSAALSISSLRVPAGYQAIGYSGDTFTGTAWTFSGDAPDLQSSGNNDAIVSLRVRFNPSTYLRLTNVRNGLALDSGGSVATGSNLKQWTWDGSVNLQWQLVDLGTGYYRLVNRGNGMVADGYGATANGANLQQAPWNGSNNQQWRLTDQGSGRYQIANRATGLLIDGGGAVASGTAAIQWNANSSTNTMWTVIAL